MTASVLCRSTRYGLGCGHPVGDHVGFVTTNKDCCCCNGHHNLPGHQEQCIDCLRRKLVKPGMTAAEFARQLPEDLRPLYWRRKLAEWAETNGIDPDEDTP